MKRPIRVLAVTHNKNHGLVYQRLHLPFRDLDPSDFSVRFVDITDVGNCDCFYADVLVMAHPWDSRFEYLALRAKSRYNLPVIIDIDDLITELPSDHPDYVSFKGNRVAQVVEMASACVYSTQYIGHRYGHLNSNFTVIPNTIPRWMYESIGEPVKPYKNAFSILWTGGQSHRSDQLHTFLPGLREFLRRHDDARCYFHVLCPDILLQEFGSQVVFEPNVVDFLDYPGVSAAYPADVLLVGLHDHPFNHAKSDLKLLELGAHGVPIIASPRSDFIQHKDRGIMLYAEDNSSQYKSWLEALEIAYETRESGLKEMGRRAKDYIFSERTSDKASAAWAQVLRETVEG